MQHGAMALHHAFWPPGASGGVKDRGGVAGVDRNMQCIRGVTLVDVIEQEKPAVVIDQLMRSCCVRGVGKQQIRRCVADDVALGFCRHRGVDAKERLCRLERRQRADHHLRRMVDEIGDASAPGLRAIEDRAGQLIGALFDVAICPCPWPDAADRQMRGMFAHHFVEARRDALLRSARSNAIAGSAMALGELVFADDIQFGVKPGLACVGDKRLVGR